MPTLRSEAKSRRRCKRRARGYVAVRVTDRNVGRVVRDLAVDLQPGATDDALLGVVRLLRLVPRRVRLRPRLAHDQNGERRPRRRRGRDRIACPAILSAGARVVTATEAFLSAFVARPSLAGGFAEVEVEIGRGEQPPSETIRQASGQEPPTARLPPRRPAPRLPRHHPHGSAPVDRHHLDVRRRPHQPPLRHPYRQLPSVVVTGVVLVLVFVRREAEISRAAGGLRLGGESRAAYARSAAIRLFAETLQRPGADRGHARGSAPRCSSPNPNASASSSSACSPWGRMEAGSRDLRAQARAPEDIVDDAVRAFAPQRLAGRRDVRGRGRRSRSLRGRRPPAIVDAIVNLLSNAQNCRRPARGPALRASVTSRGT